MKKRVSIADVAKLAEASISTVSRVINDTGYPVSKDVQERILAAVKQLHYIPNLAAQRLRNDFNPVIGLIVRDIAEAYFGEIAKGATERAMELGYLAFVCNTGRKPANEMEFHELLWKNRVRGIVLVGGGIDTPEYRHLLEQQMERCDRFGLRIFAIAPQGIDIPTVSVDFVAMTEKITSYLIVKGHSMIGFITGDKVVTTSKDHVQGYRNALGAAHLEAREELARFDSFSEHGGYSNCRILMQQSPRPTAIICGCDPIAVGVLHALHDEGLEVPRDVSLVSIGDTPIAAHLRPALTCMRVPRYRMGARAVEKMLDPLADNASEYFPVEFIERGSVRNLDA
ncbi:MAG: LacI family transcriptional regulator [Spirochaetes bacterium]|nr:MAG: LacI family transcriptional regulator [Spirochaetota bacterium]